MATSTALPTPTEPYVLHRDEGTHGHFLNHLATLKSTTSTDGAMSIVEFVAPRGFGPPLHRHLDEDEVILVMEGEVVFRWGDAEMTAADGGMAYLPRAVPHSFQVLSHEARLFTVTAAIDGRPRFDRFVAALSVPTADPTMPEPSEVDPARIAVVGGQHGIEILGPPPGPVT
ncbi:MAG: cupin domain-containing protein [Actinomycetota bacterium]